LHIDSDQTSDGPMLSQIDIDVECMIFGFDELEKFINRDYCSMKMDSWNSDEVEYTKRLDNLSIWGERIVHRIQTEHATKERLENARLERAISELDILNVPGIRSDQVDELTAKCKTTCMSIRKSELDAIRDMLQFIAGEAMAISNQSAITSSLVDIKEGKQTSDASSSACSDDDSHAECKSECEHVDNFDKDGVEMLD